MRDRKPSDRKPKDLSTLLVAVFVVSFIMVKNYNDDSPLLEARVATNVATQPERIHIAALAKNRNGYGIATIDARTGRADGMRFDVVFKDYDNCLMALFSQRAASETVDAQQKIRLKCEKTVF